MAVVNVVNRLLRSTWNVEVVKTPDMFYFNIINSDLPIEFSLEKGIWCPDSDYDQQDILKRLKTFVLQCERLNTDIKPQDVPPLQEIITQLFKVHEHFVHSAKYRDLRQQYATRNLP